MKLNNHGSEPISLLIWTSGCKNRLSLGRQVGQILHLEVPFITSPLNALHTALGVAQITVNDASSSLLIISNVSRRLLLAKWFDKAKGQPGTSSTWTLLGGWMNFFFSWDLYWYGMSTCGYLLRGPFQFDKIIKVGDGKELRNASHPFAACRRRLTSRTDESTAGGRFYILRRFCHDEAAWPFFLLSRQLNKKFSQLKLARKALFLLGPGFFVEDLPPG